MAAIGTSNTYPESEMQTCHSSKLIAMEASGNDEQKDQAWRILKAGEYAPYIEIARYLLRSHKNLFGNVQVENLNKLATSSCIKKTPEYEHLYDRTEDKLLRILESIPNDQLEQLSENSSAPDLLKELLELIKDYKNLDTIFDSTPYINIYNILECFLKHHAFVDVIGKIDEKSRAENFHGKAGQPQLGISKFLATQGYLDLALEIAIKVQKKHYSSAPEGGFDPSNKLEIDLFEEPIFDIEATIRDIQKALALHKNTFENT